MSKARKSQNEPTPRSASKAYLTENVVIYVETSLLSNYNEYKKTARSPACWP